MPTPNADGLDLSHWNVVTDESAIPHYPLMSCKATEGSAFVSPKFVYFWELFARHGSRYRGAYHWVRSSTSMRSQVDHLARQLDKVGGLQVGDFVQLDWETTAGIPNMTVDQIEEWVALGHARWGDRIIVYGSDWVPNFLAWRKANPTVPIWYANYNVGDKATGGWAECAKYDAAVWQWSSTFKAPGFLWNPDNADDGVDVNHVFDWATLGRLCLREPADDDDDDFEPPPVVVVAPIVEEEDSMRIQVDPTNQTWWFEKVGVDLRRVGTAKEFDKLPGAKADGSDIAVLSVNELWEALESSRHTYGEVDPEMGAGFVAAWDAKRDPGAGSGGGGDPVTFPPYLFTGEARPA